MFKAFLVVSAVFIVKSLLLSFLPGMTQSIVVLSYAVGLFTRLIFNLADEYISLDESMYNTIDAPTTDNSNSDFTDPFLADNESKSSKRPHSGSDFGESSSKKPNTGLPSSPVIGPEDFESDSDSPSFVLSDNEDYQSYTKVDAETPRERQEKALAIAKASLKEFKTSGTDVPAAKQQIAYLEEKIAEIKAYLGDSSDSESEGSSSDSEGSSADSKKDPKDSSTSKDKGKGKAE
jgi:hypothetical protein